MRLGLRFVGQPVHRHKMQIINQANPSIPPITLTTMIVTVRGLDPDSAVVEVSVELGADVVVALVGDGDMPNISPCGPRTAHVRSVSMTACSNDSVIRPSLTYVQISRACAIVSVSTEHTMPGSNEIDRRSDSRSDVCAIICDFT